MRNLPMHLWRELIQHKDATALQFSEALPHDKTSPFKEATFAEWGRQIQRAAIGLLELGLEPGARVGLVAQCSREWFTLAVATWMAGGCVVPVRHDLDRSQTLRALARSGCDLIALSHLKKLDVLRGQGGQLPGHLRWILLHHDPAKDGTPPQTDQILTWEAMLEKGKFRELRGGDKMLAKRMYDVPLEQPSLILYDPRDEALADPHGAFFSGKDVAGYLDTLSQDLRLKPDRSNALAIAMNPGWFHAFLLGLATLQRGQAVVLERSARQLIEHLPDYQPGVMLVHSTYLEDKGKALCAILERQPEVLHKLEEGVTEQDRTFSLLNALNIVGKQAALRTLYDPLRRELGRNLHTIYKVGPSLSEGVAELFEKLDIEVLSIHGYAEAMITHMERPGATRRGAVGRPVLGVSARIEGSTSESDTGQLLIQSDVMMRGYWDESGPLTVSEDGWLGTSDQARIESGYLFLAPFQPSRDEPS